MLQAALRKRRPRLHHALAPALLGSEARAHRGARNRNTEGHVLTTKRISMRTGENRARRQLYRPRLFAFIRLGRPHYLLKSALLYGLGASVAIYRQHQLAIAWYLFGQLFVSCVHLMTHYCNEFF